MEDINNILLAQPRLNSLAKDIKKLEGIHQLWDAWSKPDSSEKQLVNTEIISKSIPLGINNNVLTVACDTPLIANHLRLISQTIIQQISNFGINGISTLHFLVLSEKDTHRFQKPENNQTKFRQIDNESILILEKFKASCTSDKMSVSITKLIDTLKSNN